MTHQQFLKYASAFFIASGLVLLFGPEDWFPDSYHPRYMGAVSLLSPFLVYLPNLILRRDNPRKRALLLNLRSIIAFSLILNSLGTFGLYQMYRYGFEYDKFGHFLVSMLAAFILCEILREWKELPKPQVIIPAILIIFGAGIAWEGIEFVSDLLFETQEWGVYGQDVMRDTTRDIFFNTIGSIAGIVVFKIPSKRSVRKSKERALSARQ